MIAVDVDGVIRFANPAAEQMFGRAHGDLDGANIEDLVPSPTRAAHRELRAAYHLNATCRPMEASREVWAVRSDGTRFPVEISLSTMPEHDELVVATIVNTSYRRCIADLLSTVERARVDGFATLVANLAHEMNTPTGALNASAQVTSLALRRLHEEVDRTNEHISRPLSALEQAAMTIVEASSRITGIVDRLRDFAHLDQGERAWLDINRCVNAAVAAVHLQTERPVGVDLLLETVPSVFGSPREINQVLMNLVMNAIQAVEDRAPQPSYVGRVVVRTSGAPDHVSLEVEDNGCGIDAAMLHRLFDPGFTTRPRGVASGLGLTTVKRIVDRHGGSVKVHSQVGHGTSVQIALPLSQAEEINRLR